MKLITNSTISYKLDDPFLAIRFMCPSCGLIFDDNAKEDGDPGTTKWSPNSDDPEISERLWNGEDIEFTEECPRCAIRLSKNDLIPVTVSPKELTQPSKITFLVEDHAHKTVLSKIAECMHKSVDVERAGNADNVKRFASHYNKLSIFKNVYFLVDGDNQPLKNPEHPNLIQLGKYCIENYLLDTDICGLVIGLTQDRVNSILREAITKYFFPSLRNVKANNKCVNQMPDLSAVLDCMDGSKILPHLLSSAAGWSPSKKDKYHKEYVKKAFETGRLSEIFPSEIINVIASAPDKEIL